MSVWVLRGLSSLSDSSKLPFARGKKSGGLASLRLVFQTKRARKITASLAV